MNILRKIFTILMFLLGLSGCAGTDYYYNPIRDSLPEKTYVSEDHLETALTFAGKTTKNAPLVKLAINLNSKHIKTFKPLNDKAKIEANGKEYWVKIYYGNSKEVFYIAVSPYNEGIVDIVGNFSIYFGKVKLEDKNGNKRIVDVSPLNHERDMEVYTVFTTDPTDSGKYYHETIYEVPLKNAEQKLRTIKANKVSVEEVKN